MKNIICKIFGHNFDMKEYNQKLRCPELKCVRCGKERLGYEYYIPKKPEDLQQKNKTEYFTVKRCGNKANYAVEWMSLDKRYCRNVYEFKKDSDAQSNHLNSLGRWNSGTMKISTNKAKRGPKAK